VTTSTVKGDRSNRSRAGTGDLDPYGAVTLENTTLAGTMSLDAGVEGVVGLMKVASITAMPAGLTLADILEPGGLAADRGPMKTIALVEPSPRPAVDTGDAASCAARPVIGLDQHGQPRTPPCDIRACELQP
jgi:hypothetical protein